MRCSITLLFAILMGGCAAQSGPWTIYNTGNSGLPSNYVRAIVQDGTDYWIGTNAGTARFDGVTWTVYNTLNSGLPSDEVRAIVIDGVDKWFATVGGGIAKFDGVTWTVFNTLNSGLPHDNVLCLTMDEEGFLWLGTTGIPIPPYGGGAARFDKVNAWTYYNTGNSGLVFDNVRCVNADDLGDVWFGTLWGLSRMQGTIWTSYTTLDSPMQCDDVRALVHDADGDLWIGTYGCGTAGGALEFDGVNWAVYDTTNSSLEYGSVAAICIDGCGQAWMGSDFLSRFDGSNWTLFDTASSALPDVSVFVVTEDSQQRIWVGTLAGGVAVFDNDCAEGTGIDPSIAVAPAVTLSPNPATDAVLLHFTNAGNERCELTLFDATGRKVGSVQETSGQEVVIQRNGMPAGLFSFLLRTGDGQVRTGSFLFEP